MEDALRAYLKSKIDLSPDYSTSCYQEDINKDAATNKWLEPHSEIDIIGHFCFSDGENDDIARVLKRMMGCLKEIHPVFEDD